MFGFIADQASSRKYTLQAGFILNACATALLCFSTDVWLLLLSRALQGFSAAIVYTVGFAILVDTVDTDRIGGYMGYGIISVNIGMTIAPTIGGALYERVGYYSTFFVMFSLIALDILMRLVMVEKKAALKWEAHDEAIGKSPPTQYGTMSPVQDTDEATHTGAEVAEPSKAVSRLSDEDENNPTEPVTEDTQGQENAIISSPSRSPYITLLSSPRILADLYGSLVVVALLVSFDSSLSLFVHRTFGWGPGKAGLIFITITLPILGAPMAGKVTDKYRSRWIPALGFIVLGVLTGLLALIRHADTKEVALFCFLLVLNGTSRLPLLGAFSIF